jgi:transposase
MLGWRLWCGFFSYSTVKEWTEQFRLGRERGEDEPRVGRPVEVVTEKNIRHIEEALLSDRRPTFKEMSVRLKIPKTTIIRIIHENLHMKKVSARWVSRLLSSIQKEHHLTCQKLWSFAFTIRIKYWNQLSQGMKP